MLHMPTILNKVKQDLADHNQNQERSGIKVNTMMASFADVTALVGGYEYLERRVVELEALLAPSPITLPVNPLDLLGKSWKTPD